MFDSKIPKRKAKKENGLMIVGINFKKKNIYIL